VNIEKRKVIINISLTAIALQITFLTRWNEVV